MIQPTNVNAQCQMQCYNSTDTWSAVSNSLLITETSSDYYITEIQMNGQLFATCFTYHKIPIKM